MRAPSQRRSSISESSSSTPSPVPSPSFFFFNDTAPTEIYTLSLHDALPISAPRPTGPPRGQPRRSRALSFHVPPLDLDRKSTRLNSSHSQISYAVFCLKKKNRNRP